jgi:hypothetical protein
MEVESLMRTCVSQEKQDRTAAVSLCCVCVLYLSRVDLVAQKLHVLHDNVDETLDHDLLHEIRVVLPVGRNRVDLEHLFGLVVCGVGNVRKKRPKGGMEGGRDPEWRRG